MPLPQQQLTFVPVQLRRQPTLPCPFNDLRTIPSWRSGVGVTLDDALVLKRATD